LRISPDHQTLRTGVRGGLPIERTAQNWFNDLAFARSLGHYLFRDAGALAKDVFCLARRAPE